MPLDPNTPSPVGGTADRLPPTDGATLLQDTGARALSGELSRAPVVPGYTLLEVLGAGSYGEVWRARDATTGVEVAIKFYRRGASGAWEHLLAEVKKLALLQNDRGIVPLREVVADAARPYYVMALAEGGSLGQRLEQRRTAGRAGLPVAEALPLFRSVVETLAYVHLKGIRHCDLKPCNVLLDGLGRPLVADFGQALLSDDASPGLGTFFYMAPEQATLTPQTPDARWDVYGLGALFYALLTGTPPRADETVRADLQRLPRLGDKLARYRAWLQANPPARGHRGVPGVDRDLAALVDRCLAVDPARRYRDAGAVWEALEQRERRRRRKPLLLVGLIVPLLVLFILVYATVAGARQAERRTYQKLVEQQTENNRDSARLIANALSEQTEARLRLLLNRATSPDLVRALRAARAGDATALRLLEARLTNLLTVAAEAKRDFAEASLSSADGRVLGLVRAEGGRIVASPWEERRLKAPYPQYSWRDWFSGGGDRWDETDRLHPPIRAAHVSAPYVSTLDASMFVSLSVPVRAAEGGEPEGVLEAAVRLDDISAWITDVNLRGGFAAVLDKRDHYLLHGDAATIRPVPRTPARRWDATDLRRSLAEQTSNGGATVEAFVDPVDGQSYVAGAARLKADTVGWVVLVQHGHDRVREATRLEVASDRQTYLAWAGLLGLAGALVLSLWAWLYLVVRRAA